MTQPPALDVASIEAIARRTAELLRDELLAELGALVADHRGDHDGKLIDVKEVARRFDVGVDYVYANAGRLGAIRLGGGPRARLRFDPAMVDKALRADAAAPPEPTPPRPRSPRRPAAKRQPSELLPIKEGRRGARG